jgi:hypothetical protein
MPKIPREVEHMTAPDTKATTPATAVRYLHGVARHFRSNVVAYLALVVAIASGGGYALAASRSDGTISVCVDQGSGVMHLAKHARCGRHQRRIGLSSALDRPTVSAWAEVFPNGRVVTGAGVSIRHAGVGVYTITVSAASCRNAGNNAPVVSVSDTEPPGGQSTSSFPVAWTMPAGTGFKAFTVYTGVVVGGGFQPRDEFFNFTDSCG